MRHSLFLLLLSFPAALTAFTHPFWRQSQQQPSLVRKRGQVPQPRSASPHNDNRRAADAAAAHPSRGSTRFANRKAASFHVRGTKIPEVDFDPGDSWAGLLPISSHPKETRKLFFWYYPSTPQGNDNDLIFWTNGGPGCSSLEGFLQGNGPISWQFGQAKPTPNPYSWTSLGHMLWVEQPVGTGFSQGEPNIHNEVELAAQVVGFLQQFFDIFSELKGKNFYLAGESYAGLYLPYIADYIQSNPTGMKVQGLWLGSPLLTQDVVAIEAPAVNFVHKNPNVFPFDQSFIAQINQIADRCNYTSYLKKYLTYPPPPAPFPLPGASAEADPGCEVYSSILEAVLLLNPAFDVYRIFNTPPILWDVLGFPGTFPQVQVEPVYFNRRDVKAAIHAPAKAQWTECTDTSVFVDGIDTSPPASWEVLPRVIANGTRTVVVTGLADFVLISEGTRIAIQNMTWGGKQGFQSVPTPDSFIVDGVGAFGTVQSDRGLTLYELPITGHMIPQFNPPAAFQTMEFLLGARDTT